MVQSEFDTGESMGAGQNSGADKDDLLEARSIHDAQLGWLRLLGNAVVRALKLEASKTTADPGEEEGS